MDVPEKKQRQVSAVRKWEKSHREKYLEIKRNYYQRNKEYCKAFNKKNRYKYAGRYKEHNTEYNKTHPEIVNRNQLNYVKKLSKNFKLPINQFRSYLQHWAKSVRKRDTHQCQICGVRGEFAHHILFKSNYPELSFNINNGITLCKTHHKEIHASNPKIL